MSDVEVSSWKECIKRNQTRKIPVKKLDDYIKNLRYAFQFPARDLTNECSKIIKDLATTCNARGLTSTIHGDLDEKTRVYGVFHCLLEDDGTVSVFYAVHTLALEVARQRIQPELRVITDVQKDELEHQIASQSLARSATKTLSEMGVDLNLSSVGK